MPKAQTQLAERYIGVPQKDFVELCAMTLEILAQRTALIKQLEAVADQLESVWRDQGRPNIHVTASRNLIARLGLEVPTDHTEDLVQ